MWSVECGVVEWWSGREGRHAGSMGVSYVCRSFHDDAWRGYFTDFFLACGSLGWPLCRTDRSVGAASGVA